MSHIERILDMPCAICVALSMRQEGRTFAHHIRTGQGGSQRADDALSLPLCWEHHQGTSGIHGTRSAWKLAKLTELDVLASVIRDLTSGAVPQGTLPKRQPRRVAKADRPEYQPPSKMLRHPGVILP